MLQDSTQSVHREICGKGHSETTKYKWRRRATNERHNPGSQPQSIKRYAFAHTSSCKTQLNVTLSHRAATTGLKGSQACLHAPPWQQLPLATLGCPAALRLGSLQYLAGHRLARPATTIFTCDTITVRTLRVALCDGRIININAPG